MYLFILAKLLYLLDGMSEQTINYDAFGYTLSHRMVSIGGLLFAKKLCKNLRQKLDSEVSRGKFYLDSWSNSEDSRSLKTSSTQDFRSLFNFILVNKPLRAQKAQELIFKKAFLLLKTTNTEKFNLKQQNIKGGTLVK